MHLVDLLGYPAIGGAFAVHWFGHGAPWEPAVTFVLAAIGVIPLAQLMGRATSHLACRMGPTWGGLLNASFGNAAELMIAIIALTKGLNAMVKASVTGSILGNLLLVAGGAMVVGGWGREEQQFSRQAAETNAGLLTLAVAAMLCPAIFHFSAERLHDRALVEHEWGVSLATSVALYLPARRRLVPILPEKGFEFWPCLANCTKLPTLVARVHLRRLRFERVFRLQVLPTLRPLVRRSIVNTTRENSEAE